MLSDPTTPMKPCTLCGITKPLTEFFVKDKKSGRLFARCKSCHNAQTLDTYHAKQAGVWQPKENPPILAERACSKCGVVKPLAEFGAAKTARDGHRSNCKECVAAAARDYVAAHPDRVKEAQAKYVAANPEKRRDTYLRSNVKRKESGALAAYTRAAPHRRRAYHAKRYVENREQMVVQHKKWASANRDVVASIGERWRANKVNAPVNDFTVAQWRDMLAYYNGYCGYCGEPCDAPEQEHMVPLSRGGSHTESNLAVACRACNARKHTRTLAEYLLALA